MGHFAWWGTSRQENIQLAAQKAAGIVTKIRTSKEKISYCIGIIEKKSRGQNFVLRQANTGNELVSRIVLGLHYIQTFYLAMMNLRLTCNAVYTNTIPNNSCSKLLATKGTHQNLTECTSFPNNGLSFSILMSNKLGLFVPHIPNITRYKVRGPILLE